MTNPPVQFSMIRNSFGKNYRFFLFFYNNLIRNGKSYFAEFFHKLDNKTGEDAIKKLRFPIWREALAQSLELPRDLACRDALLTMTGESQLLVENYRAIREYTPGHLLIQAANCRIRIEGKHLQIRYYNNEEMQIEGQIEVIRFEP